MSSAGGNLASSSVKVFGRQTYSRFVAFHRTCWLPTDKPISDELTMRMTSALPQTHDILQLRRPARLHLWSCQQHDGYGIHQRCDHPGHVRLLPGFSTS